MKEKLRLIIEDISTKQGRFFAFFIQFLIIVSVITFSIETTPNLDPQIIKTLRIIELICVVVFSIEYLLRIYVSDRKWKFVFSFFGVIDLIAILPFYLSIGIDLRSIRALRLLRIFRVLKIVRYNKAMQKFARALHYAKEEMILFLFLTMIILYLSAVGIYYFENSVQPEKFSSVFDSLWWAVATLTTVGYGDVYPITVGGKIFTFIMLIVGLSIIAVPAGIISSALTNSITKKKKQEY